MTVFEIAEMLGKALKEDERLVALEEAKTAYEADAQLKTYMMEYDVQQKALQNEIAKPEKDSHLIDMIQNRIDELYHLIVGNAAFLGCSALSLVSLPLSLTSIGVDAFLGCDSLDVLAFGGGGMDWTRVKVGAHNEALDGIVTLADGTRFDGAFVTGSCTETIQFVLDAEGHLLLTGEGSIPDYTYLEQAPWSDFSDRIRKVTVEGNIDVVGKFAFGRCTNLEEVVLGDSVRLIEDSAFYECYRMTTVTFPANLRRIGSGAFYGCASLSRAVLPDSVTHVGRGAFMNCISLSEVTLGTGITSVEAWTFSGCESLFTITAAAPVNEVGVGAFNGCPTAITPQE